MVPAVVTLAIQLVLIVVLAVPATLAVPAVLAVVLVVLVLVAPVPVTDPAVPVDLVVLVDHMVPTVPAAVVLLVPEAKLADYATKQIYLLSKDRKAAITPLWS